MLRKISKNMVILTLIASISGGMITNIEKLGNNTNIGITLALRGDIESPPTID
ncbi:MAG: hypothetical protein IJF37_00565 [Lachnospiraceae bacterium]|nr:hypothetical protein [Lachnospiraceae bacterium]